MSDNINGVSVEIFNHKGFIRLKHPEWPVFVTINTDMDKNTGGFIIEFSEEQLIIYPAHINAFEVTMNLAASLVKQLLSIYYSGLIIEDSGIPKLGINNQGVIAILPD